MQKLKDIVKEYLDETLWEADCVLRSDRGQNITIITDNLRGVCGITVVTIASPARKVSDHVERTLLKIKFFRQEPTIQQQLEKMSIDARKIDGIFSFIPKNAQRVVSRIYRPKRRRDV